MKFKEFEERLFRLILESKLGNVELCDIVAGKQRFNFVFFCLGVLENRQIDCYRQESDQQEESWLGRLVLQTETARHIA